MGLSKNILILIFVFSVLTSQSQDGRQTYTAEAKVFENNALDLSNQIEVYPNPSIDYLIVNIKDSNLKHTDFEMHSVIGNTVDVLVERVGKDQFKIDVKEYASGYYFLVVKDDQTQFKRAFKFLKK